LRRNGTLVARFSAEALARDGLTPDVASLARAFRELGMHALQGKIVEGPSAKPGVIIAARKRIRVLKQVVQRVYDDLPLDGSRSLEWVDSLGEGY